MSSAHPSGCSRSPRRRLPSPSSLRMTLPATATARLPTFCAACAASMSTTTATYSYVGARGFAKPGDYNSRILLLVNGHRVNDNVFGQAAIGAEFGLDPAMFERVGDHPRAGLVALWRQRILRRSSTSSRGRASRSTALSMQLDVGTLDTQRVRAQRTGSAWPTGSTSRSRPRFEQSGGVQRLYFPGIRYAGHQQRHRGRARRRAARAASTAASRFKNFTVTGAYGTGGARTSRRHRSARCSTSRIRRSSTTDRARVPRRSVRALVRRHARGDSRLVRSVLLRRHLSVSRATTPRRRCSPSTTGGRLAMDGRWRGLTRRAARPPDADGRRRVHRQLPSESVAYVTNDPGLRTSRSIGRRSRARRSRRTRSSCASLAAAQRRAPL